MIGEDGKQHTISADPLNHCTSLDAPLDDEDGGAATLGDLQEDATAAAELDAVENELFREQLHSDLEEALAKLTAREADVLRRRYYHQQPLREVGEAYGVTWSRAPSRQRKQLCARYAATRHCAGSMMRSYSTTYTGARALQRGSTAAA